MTKSLNCIAYYLGQFHPIPENDSFWGEGFTEWHNVARARPLYPGHRQPHLPGRFGFYDLRCTETLQAQIEYAHEIGITAFCFWHYWFAGKRLLHRPLDDMLNLGHPKFRFILGWANETWSGIWHGAPDKIIVRQTYTEHELIEHAKLISHYINTGQYLDVGGSYPFVVYKPKLIPHAASYLKDLKCLVRVYSGKDLYLIGNWSPGRRGAFNVPSDYGLDAAVITPLGARFQNRPAQIVNSSIWRGLRRLNVGPEMRPYRELTVTLEHSIQQIRGIAHASVVTGWDNTARSGRRGLVLTGYTEDGLRRTIRHAVDLERKNDNKLLFFKSWNEWAEGNIIEPSFREKWSAGDVIREELQRFALLCEAIPSQQLS